MLFQVATILKFKNQLSLRKDRFKNSNVFIFVFHFLINILKKTIINTNETQLFYLL